MFLLNLNNICLLYERGKNLSGTEPNTYLNYLGYYFIL
jgi:hypothetical protein